MYKAGRPPWNEPRARQLCIRLSTRFPPLGGCMHRELKDNLLFVGRHSELRSLRALIVLSAVFFLTAMCFAQIDRSGLSGIVTDPAGQLLPQTRITAVQNSTQLRRETVSSPVGSYDIPELPVGIYTITFDHPGFKTLTFVEV